MSTKRKAPEPNSSARSGPGSSQYPLENLLPASWPQQISSWLAEDTPDFDWGGFVVGSGPGTATLYCKTDGATIAGLPFFCEVFRQVGCECNLAYADGHVSDLSAAKTKGKLVVGTVSGPVNAILRGERVGLNILSRCSAVATATAAARALADANGWNGRVAATRKTTPGFRFVEKFGVLVGGGDTHRMNLSHMTMLKDNHVDARGGSIPEAVAAALSVGGFATKVEVECRSLADALAAATAGAHIVMLDNFQPADLHAAAKAVKAAHKHVIVEGSGGLTTESLPLYFGPDIDVLSMGSLTHGVSAIDFSLKLSKPK